MSFIWQLFDGWIPIDRDDEGLNDFIYISNIISICILSARFLIVIRLLLKNWIIIIHCLPLVLYFMSIYIYIHEIATAFHIHAQGCTVEHHLMNHSSEHSQISPEHTGVISASHTCPGL